ncbi:MAG: DUF1592 domain-containing protein [Lentisphaeraceae bacterium]|nr:DUF1592 domain-containing protein [Lentisphaeraceae bacterium]
MDQNKSRLLLKLFVPILLLGWNHSMWANDSEESFKNEIVPLLEKYCYKCHDEDVQKGDFRIDTYKDAKQILPNRKHWLKVLEQLETQEMPTKKPLPSQEEYEKLTHWVEKAVNDIDWDKIKEPGHVTIPLLTNDEYYNSLEDITGLNLRSFSKFSKDSEGVSGFTNDRDGLFVSTAKMEKYIESAEHAADSILALYEQAQTVKLETEKMFMTETREKPGKRGEFVGYFLNRGQMSLYESINLPVNGLYEFKVRAMVPSGGNGATSLRVNDKIMDILDLNGSKPEVYKTQVPLPKGSHQMTWNIASHSSIKMLQNAGSSPSNRALKKARTIAMKDPIALTPKMLKVIAKGEKKLKRLPNQLVQMRILTEELKLFSLDDNRFLIAPRIKRLKAANGFLRADVKSIDKAAKAKLSKDFFKNNKQQLKEKDAILAKFAKVPLPGKMSVVALDWIEVTGPIKPKSTQQLPLSSDADVKTFLQDFLQKAFRGHSTQSDLDKYYAAYSKNRENGESLLASLKLPLTAILVSPKFLFRDELKPTQTSFKLDDLQVASRLSHFLWMSTPDKELLELANKKELLDDKAFSAQVDRLLEDPKAKRFIKNFTSEWLGFKNLGKGINPDSKTFPEYTEELRKASKEEVYKLFEDLFKNDKSLLSLIDSKDGYLNEGLALLYGIKNIKGPELRKVTLNNPQRGGLMSMSAILAATSNPTRTNPVNRGMWVFEKLLGQHMPMPPANVPPLADNAGQKKGISLREEFEKHRENAACANCHNKIDPLGFGLENFNAIGRFRTKENGVDIDSRGKMPDGYEFNGIVELKKYILEKKSDQFLRNITVKLLSFALGRELQYFDEPAIKKIIKATKENNFSSKTLLTEVIKSFPFTHQSNRVDILGDIK